MNFLVQHDWKVEVVVEAGLEEEILHFCENMKRVIKKI